MPNLYFVGDTDNTWNDGNNWSAVSGGSGGAGVPSEFDDVIIDSNSPTCVLDVNGECLSLDIEDGIFDIDGNDLVISNSFTMSAGTTCQDTSGGGEIAADNMTISGTLGNECTFNGPDLNISIEGEASYTIVTNSNASAGVEIDGTNNCTDNGGNSNWLFSITSGSQVTLQDIFERFIN